nr:PGPGW domain-containing protein [Brevibacterium daeguense]
MPNPLVVTVVTAFACRFQRSFTGDSYTDSVSARRSRPAGWLSRHHKQGRPWFRRIRLSFLRWRAVTLRNPRTAFLYKWFVGSLGALIIAVGLIMVPFPGPGWLVVFLGVAVIASEFEWARTLLLWGRATLYRWTRWLARSHWSISASIGLLTFAFVLGVVWVSLRVVGIPEWVPGWVVPGWLGLD